MEIHKADPLFSQTVLGRIKIKNPNVLERICYKCPVCGNRLSFSEKDFHRYNMNRRSKYKSVFPPIDEREKKSFLEFECPNCRKKTRVVFGVFYGDKFPITKIDSVMIE